MKNLHNENKGATMKNEDLKRREFIADSARLASLAMIATALPLMASGTNATKGATMQKRKVGNLEVSAIGMGCMGFSHGYGKTPPKQYALEAIRAAFDFGCNFFDTAEGYGKEMFYAGHNEELVGEALQSVRKDAIIATKFHLSDEEGKKPLYETIKAHLNASMKRLKTDYVDLYYWHRINETIALESVAQVMGRLIKEGLIRGWGLSQVGVKYIDTAHKITPLSAVQNLYSMMERECEKEVFPYCLQNNIAVVPFSPLASGFLSGKVTTSTKFEGDDVRKFVPQLSKDNINANQPLLELIRAYAKDKNATPAQISLAWMLHKYSNCVPIPGSKNKERILENLGAWSVALNESEFKSLEKELDKISIHGHRGIEETQQNSFGNKWKNQKFKKAKE